MDDPDKHDEEEDPPPDEATGRERSASRHRPRSSSSSPPSDAAHPPTGAGDISSHPHPAYSQPQPQQQTQPEVQPQALHQPIRSDHDADAADADAADADAADADAGGVRELAGLGLPSFPRLLQLLRAGLLQLPFHRGHVLRSLSPGIRRVLSPPHPASVVVFPPGRPAPAFGRRPSSHSARRSTSSAEGSAGSSGSTGRGDRGRGDRSPGKSPRRGKRGKEKEGKDGPHPPPAAADAAPPSPEAQYDKAATLRQIEGRVIKVAQDQHGSRFIQQRLALADEAELKLVFDEAMAAIKDLWNDVYGNFILQKLLEFGTDDMKAAIGEGLRSSAVSLSTRVYGCRVIQKAFDELGKTDVASLALAFKGNTRLCLHDHNGNHVIQKAITRLYHLGREASEDKDDASSSLFLGSLEPIVDEILASAMDLSQHPYGCRAVQRLVECCIEPHRTRILDAVVQVACRREILEDQYGNYVVQRLLKHGRPEDAEAVFRSITPNGGVVKFSRHKRASNVVEAVLRLGNPGQRQKIVHEMLHCFCVDRHNKTESAAVALSKDPYANYVVKTALEVLEEGEQRDELYGELLSNMAEMEHVSFAKKIVATIKEHQSQSEV